MFRLSGFFFLASALPAGAQSLRPTAAAVYEFQLVNSSQVKYLLPAHIVVPDDNSLNGVRRVSENDAFYSRERFRLELQPRLSGHVYVFSRNSQGGARLLYPQSGDGHNYVSRNSNVSVPVNGWFRFDRAAGQEELLVIQSAAPLDDIEQAIDENDSHADYSDIIDRYETGSSDAYDAVIVRRLFLSHRD